MRGWTPTSPPVGKSSSEARSSPSTAPKRRGRCKSWLMTPSRPSTGFRDDVRGPRRDAPAPDAGGDGHLRHPHQHLRGACIRGNGPRRLRVPALEEHRERQEDLGTYLPQTTGQDRGRDPEGRPRPLRPDAGNFKRGGRTDPAGYRDNGYLLG